MKSNLYLVLFVLVLFSATVLMSPVLAAQTAPIELTVWWPDTLVDAAGGAAVEVLSDQVNTFQRSQPDVKIDLRLKKHTGVGSLIETLGAAHTVASGSLPDVTLLRYSELRLAAQTEWIQPLIDPIPASILADVYPSTVPLGQVNNQWYGIPYALEFTHMTYRPIVLSGNFVRFDSVLADRQGFVFPASLQGKLNDMILIQYASAGGDLTELSNGNINLDALRIVLSFYQQATAEGLINTSILDYITTEDYFPQVVEGEIGAAVVRSGQYLQLLEQDTSFEAAPLPQAEGAPMTILDGWMWVVVTSDEQRQQGTRQFIEWMMDTERQSAYTRLVPTVPSRRSAMWPERKEYADFMEGLLDHAQLPVASAALTAIQNALADVLQGRRTPEQAALDALS